MTNETLRMKKAFLTIFLLTSLLGYSQDQPPGLIYSCKKEVDGKAQYDIFNSSGQKIIAKSVDWAYSNAWSWVFVLDNSNRLVTVYSYSGQQLEIDSIQETQSCYLSFNRVGLKRNGKWGFYDQQGKLRIPHLYDEISHFNNNIAAVKLGDQIYMIDTNGIRVAIPYDSSNAEYTFSDMDIAIGMGGDFSHPRFKKISQNGKVGLLDVRKNKIIIPVEFDDLIGIKDRFNRITGEKNGKYGIVDFSGQIIIPLEYESVFVLNDYF